MENLSLFNELINTTLFLKSKKKISFSIRKKKIIDKNKIEFDPIIFKNFTIKIAESNFEIKKAQSLRYKIFFKEKKIKRNNLKSLLQRDFDFYDKISEHLIIIDNNKEVKNNVIGTYRLLRGNYAKLYRGFYTEQEFDISNLKKNFSSKDILELGRSCVHPQYRSGIILKLLWQGISRYIKICKIKILMGCASFNGTNPSNFKDEFTVLTDGIAAAVTNLQFEFMENEKKREIDVLKPGYLQLFINDMRDILRYDKSSSYIAPDLARTESTEVVNP